MKKIIIVILAIGLLMGCATTEPTVERDLLNPAWVPPIPAEQSWWDKTEAFINRHIWMVVPMFLIFGDAEIGEGVS